MTEESNDQLMESYLISDGSCGWEDVFFSDEAAIIPVKCLDDERIEQMRNGEFEKILKHGGSFPCIYIDELLLKADEAGILEPMIKECMATKKFIKENER